MGKRHLVFGGRMQEFRDLFDWCKAVYITTFGSVEGRRRFARLSLADAVALYEAGDGKPLDR